MKEVKERSLERWHRFVSERDLSVLNDLLAEDVVFRSPFLWKPYHGRMAAFVVLTNVAEVFQDFTYQRQLIQGNIWALEFSARIGELSLKGIDLIQLNSQGQIQDFEVFIRPANALQALGEAMARRLQ